MEVQIHYRSSNTAAKVLFNQGESLTTESGSMIAMSPGLDLQTTTHKKGKRGLGKGLMRMLAGESFFLNHYTAKQTSELWLSTTLQGDMVAPVLQNQKIIVQSSSFVAADSSIELKTGWQGFKNILSGESLFWLELTGTGATILSSFGAIYEVEVDGDYVVDTGHIVAFEETLNFKLSKASSGWIKSYFSGEGIVCHFQGKGKLWCQSHNPREYGSALRPMLKPKSN